METINLYNLELFVNDLLSGYKFDIDLIDDTFVVEILEFMTIDNLKLITQDFMKFCTDVTFEIADVIRIFIK